MKLCNLVESEDSEWSNAAYSNKAAEISYLEKKKKALEHNVIVLWHKLFRLIDKGIIKVSPTQQEINDGELVLVPGTGGKQTNWKPFYGPKDQPTIKQFVTLGDKIALQIKSISERIKDLSVRGNTYCFTGFRSTEMEGKIRKLGGSVSTTVTQATTHLVRGDNDKVSGKMLKAQQTGVKIISRKELENVLRD